MRTYTRRRPEGQLIEDVQSLCRLCLQKSEDMTPIFLDGSDGIYATLSLRIMICVGLEVSREECFPNIICQNCHNELDRYYKFRKKCEISYQRLKLHLQAIKEKNSLNKITEERCVEQEKDSQENISNIEIVCGNNDKFSSWDLNGLSNINIVNGDISIEAQENYNVNGEGNMHIANHTESKEIETQIHDADNPEISSFLSTVLIQLGILDQQDSTLSVLDHGINNLELVMGDDEIVTLELVEEDDDSVEDNETVSINDKVEPIVLNSMGGESNKGQSNDTPSSDNVEEQVMTINDVTADGSPSQTSTPALAVTVAPGAESAASGSRPAPPCGDTCGRTRASGPTRAETADDGLRSAGCWNDTDSCTLIVVRSSARSAARASRSAARSSRTRAHTRRRTRVHCTCTPARAAPRCSSTPLV